MRATDVFGADAALQQAKLLKAALSRHGERMRSTVRKTVEGQRAEATALASAAAGRNLAADWTAFALDAVQRWVLTLDALRRRDLQFEAHEAAGAPPVLAYAFDVVVDGADLPRPCNYMLLAIRPPEGVQVHAWKRPYIIIDPRAGHGPGIGGFKTDSQVGVALRDGHPVYFVAFRQKPEPGQTLADVTHAEAAFLRAVADRHPDSARPVVLGNCQGGWATAVLAARNPALAGPIVLNGAPMSYWSGRLGQDPMRYSGGMVGGLTPALFLSDVGGGVFDGAHLVQNFETLNPGRNWFRKYFDLYDQVDVGVERFLEFERWWGGFFLMNEAEIRWIVENLFVGNKLGKGEARLETGRPIDLKAINAPVIVFASHGDNITPPQQALNWIVDTYADESEIEIRGQRILYMVHEEVGHLGIFVSSSVAKREHAEMASTLKTIEALPPGLYEMTIERVTGDGHEKTFEVDFRRARFEDIRALDEGREEEAAFAAVARVSETMAEAYDVAIRPAVRAAVAFTPAELRRSAHPLRMQRSVLGARQPLGRAIAATADHVRQNRRAAEPDNPFRQAERIWADWVEFGFDMMRDARAMAMEASFLAIYASPWMIAYGAPRAGGRARKAAEELRALPETRAALGAIEVGGVVEAVVRLLVMLANARGDVRRDRLERAAEVLERRRPFADLSAAERAAVIHRQTLIAQFEPEAGLAALSTLLPGGEERRAAIGHVEYVLGRPEEMDDRTRALLAEARRALDLPPSSGVAAE